MSIGLASFVAALTFMVAAAAAQDSITGYARVIDGDTIEINGLNIRLKGIDTPEHYQRCQDENGLSYRCGYTATQALKHAIGYGRVRCDLDRQQDRYGRALGICYAGGRELNRWLVREGHGLAYRRYDRRYVFEEDRAKAEGRGLHGGRYVAPWDWRRGKRLGR